MRILEEYVILVVYPSKRKMQGEYLEKIYTSFLRERIKHPFLLVDELQYLTTLFLEYGKHLDSELETIAQRSEISIPLYSPGLKPLQT